MLLSALIQNITKKYSFPSYEGENTKKDCYILSNKTKRERMQGAGNVAVQKEYVICLYIRLSIEDDDISGNSFKTESGSITTQRALLHEYINNHKEFEGCKIIEKCDM